MSRININLLILNLRQFLVLRLASPLLLLLLAAPLALLGAALLVQRRLLADGVPCLRNGRLHVHHLCFYLVLFHCLDGCIACGVPSIKITI